MNEVEKLIRKYVKEGRMLQVATANSNQPWNCTLYFASDANLNLYWISKPETRHSKELIENPKVAACIPIKFDDLNVIGLQLEGTAEIIEDPEEIKTKVKLYSDKFARGEDWYQDFIDGKNVHKLYRIKPTKFELFDTVNFDDPKQKWQPNQLS